ncbi:MAG: Amuc_1101 family PilM-like pilus complex protein [Verrucomicrobiota bacterium]
MASEKQISIDLGAQSVSMGVFGIGAKEQLTLEKFSTTRLEADPSLDGSRAEQTQTALKQLSKNLGTKKGGVRYSVSSSSVFTRFAKLPPLDTDQLEQIVGFEAQQQVPFPIEEAVWDYQTLGDPDDIDVEVVLVAMKADDLAVIDQSIRKVGMETQTVDLAPMALYNAFRYNYPEVEQPVVIVDIGAKSTNLIYVEGRKAFVRTVNFGGREITQAVAKEFGISFEQAEEKKIADGFVALGGGYSDPEDPELAAMSKVIRNSLTRLHSEVVRTNTFYRSNQFGSEPVAAFLSGAGAGLPYLQEFFREKLKIPVDYFNAFRNVKVGKKVDEALVTANAHAMGELVGLGLRGMENVPLALDLVPRMVQQERDMAKKAPLIWLAGLSLVALLASTGFWFSKASGFADGKVTDLKGAVGKLDRADKEIEYLSERYESIQERSIPYTEAVTNRVYWIDTFNQLGQAMVDDKVWFVELQPLSEGKELLSEPGRDGQILVSAGTGDDEREGTDFEIDSVRLRGLWRMNDDGGGPRVVFDYLDRLRESKRAIFDIAERDEAGQIIRSESGELEQKNSDTDLVKDLDSGTSADRFAYPFSLELPLPEGRTIRYSK